MLDRTAIIGFAIGGVIVVGALGYAAGYAGGHAAANIAAGKPNGTASCWWGDFPYYPGSQAVAAARPGGYAHHSYLSAPVVAAFYANGASQLAWTFTLTGGSPGFWTFRMARPPTCSGALTVRADPAGGTLTEADPDSP